MSFAEEFGHDIPPDDWNGGYSRKRKNFKRTENPLFKMIDVPYTGIETETMKAYLLRSEKGNFWVPKSQVQLDVAEHEVSMPKWLELGLKFIKE